VVPAPGADDSHVIRVVCCEGKSRLEMTTPDGTCATCKCFVLERPEVGKVKVYAGAHRVHLSAESWRATADTVGFAGPNRLVLTGHVRLHGSKCCDSTIVNAARLTIRFREGQVHTYRLDKDER
jgi:hypothetical protein